MLHSPSCMLVIWFLKLKVNISINTQQIGYITVPITANTCQLVLSCKTTALSNYCIIWYIVPDCLHAAWAQKRGFVTARAARHDTYRAANHILRQALEGRLCMCTRPPGYTAEKGRARKTRNLGYVSWNNNDTFWHIHNDMPYDCPISMSLLKTDIHNLESSSVCLREFLGYQIDCTICTVVGVCRNALWR